MIKPLGSRNSPSVYSFLVGSVLIEIATNWFSPADPPQPVKPNSSVQNNNDDLVFIFQLPKLLNIIYHK